MTDREKNDSGITQKNQRMQNTKFINIHRNLSGQRLHVKYLYLEPELTQFHMHHFKIFLETEIE